MVKITLVGIEMGVLGALGMGGLIFFVNLTGGASAASKAAFVQVIYSFIVITFTTSVCHWQARKNLFLAVSIPTAITTVLTYAIHYMANSPEPFWSALASFLIALGSFIIIGYRFRKTEKMVSHLLKRFFKRECLH